MHMRSMFYSARPVPAAFRTNFIHLYLDIAWFGVLSASAMSFVAVYAARQGANAFQIGLLSAGPAAVNLLFTLPAGQWLEGQSMGSAVFWTAALNRLFYLLWIPLPWLFGPLGQVWALVGLTLLMSIPGTALAVGFNALFADAVPPEWRGHVAGVRNALLAITVIVVSILCGYLLDRLSFPAGYQVVFGIGALGAAMSTAHLRFVRPRPNGQARPRTGRGLGDLAGPGTVRLLDSLRPGVALRFLVRRRKLALPSIDILKGPYGRLLAVLFAWHLTIYLAIPLFALHWVNQIHLNDQEIGLGTAVFYVAVFVGSTQLARLVRRLGNQRVTAVGAMFMASYPAFMAAAKGLDLFLIGSASGGFGWSLVAGSLTNYLLEKIPGDRRPAYLAWFNLEMNAALLLGSLLGPLLANWMSVPLALALFAGLRFVAALALLLWERQA
jgi:MFS family permease